MDIIVDAIDNSTFHFVYDFVKKTLDAHATPATPATPVTNETNDDMSNKMEVEQS